MMVDIKYKNTKQIKRNNQKKKIFRETDSQKTHDGSYWTQMLK